MNLFPCELCGFYHKKLEEVFVVLILESELDDEDLQGKEYQKSLCYKCIKRIKGEEYAYE